MHLNNIRSLNCKFEQFQCLLATINNKFSVIGKHGFRVHLTMLIFIDIILCINIGLIKPVAVLVYILILNYAPINVKPAEGRPGKGAGFDIQTKFCAKFPLPRITVLVKQMIEQNTGFEITICDSRIKSRISRSARRSEFQKN